MKKNALTHEQRAIQHQQTKNDQDCKDWLKQNGLNEKYFTVVAVELLQAQKVATNILKHNGRYLAQNQAATLNNFLLAMSRKDKRKKLTIKHALTVMNIGKEVNRKLFKAYRKTQAQTSR